MKSTLTLTFSLLSFASAGGAVDGNPDEAAIRAQYRALEQAMLKQDTKVILNVYAPQFVGWGPRYEPLPREALTASAPGMVTKSVKLTPLKLERQGNAYLVTARGDVAGEYAMGEQKVPFTQSQQTADLWQKVAGRWQITESRSLSVNLDMGGQKQTMTDPAPLTPSERQTLGAAFRAAVKPISLAPDAKADDLAFLNPLAAARVIGVGEGSHGTHEQFVLKARIFKALVQQYGFTTLAFESNRAGAEAINAYIGGQSADLQAAVNALGFLVWRTAEVRDLLVWMREYNASRGQKPALKFLAVDMQDPGGSATLLTKLSPELRDATTPFVALEPYAINELVQNAAKRDTFLKQADALVKAAAALPGGTPRRADVQVLARTVQQAVLAASGQGTRDDFMAENLLAALNADPQTKMMLWAHNGHVSKAPDPMSQTGMGQRLTENLGSNYRTIGQTFTGGTIRAIRPDQPSKGMQAVTVATAHPDSPEALTAAAGPSVLVMNDVKVPALRDYLNVPRPIRGIGNSGTPGMMGYTFEVLPKAFDVLIFTGTSTPTKPAN